MHFLRNKLPHNLSLYISMPKQRKSTMQLLRLPFKAREVLMLQDYRKFSYFINTIIGYAWESKSVHGCFRRFKVSPPSSGRLLGRRQVLISEYWPSSELWTLRYTWISTTCPSTRTGFRGIDLNGSRGRWWLGERVRRPRPLRPCGRKATSAHVRAGPCGLKEGDRQL